MKYCKKCVQPDSRPNVYFNDEGICGACLYQEDVENKIDWNQRQEELKNIAEKAKQKAKEMNSNYDCAVGVSGGKDSTLQALYARDTLGLRTLLVNCEPEGLSEIGRKNIENIKQLGFDTISIRPNPKTMKGLIKRDFYKYINPVKVTEFPIWASTYRMAHLHKIPLIIQGENDCLTLGVRNDQGMGGDAMLVSEQDTLASGWKEYLEEGVEEKDLYYYYFEGKQMKQDGIEAIWLQYYLKEWSQSKNAAFAMTHGLVARPHYFDPHSIGTYAGYYALDGDLNQVNQMIKYIKFGFGQCTDHACYDIRDGRLSRKEAIELVKRYDGQCDIRYVKQFCDYIEISLDEFWKVVDSARGPMWKKDNKGEWQLDDPIWKQQ